jgi:hypothetical protein
MYQEIVEKAWSRPTWRAYHIIATSMAEDDEPDHDGSASGQYDEEVSKFMETYEN